MAEDFIIAQFAGAAAGTDLATFTPTRGGPFTRHPAASYADAVVQVTAGSRLRPKDPGITIHRAGAVPPSANYSVRMDLTVLSLTGGDVVGPMLRCASSDTYYAACWIFAYGIGVGMALIKHVAGVETILTLRASDANGNNVEPSQGKTSVLTVGVVGSTLTMYSDGVAVYTLDDASVADVGSAGLYIRNGGSDDNSGIQPSGFYANPDPTFAPATFGPAPSSGPSPPAIGDPAVRSDVGYDAVAAPAPTAGSSAVAKVQLYAGAGDNFGSMALLREHAGAGAYTFIVPSAGRRYRVVAVDSSDPALSSAPSAAVAGAAGGGSSAAATAAEVEAIVAAALAGPIEATLAGFPDLPAKLDADYDPDAEEAAAVSFADRFAARVLQLFGGIGVDATWAGRLDAKVSTRSTLAGPANFNALAITLGADGKGRVLPDLDADPLPLRDQTENATPTAADSLAASHASDVGDMLRPTPGSGVLKYVGGALCRTFGFTPTARS